MSARRITSQSPRHRSSVDPPPIVGTGIRQSTHHRAFRYARHCCSRCSNSRGQSFRERQHFSGRNAASASPGGARERNAPANGGTGGNSTSPGGNAGGANGNGAVVPGISVSGGNPKNSTGISGLSNGAKANSRSPLRVTPGTRWRRHPEKSEASPDSQIAGRSECPARHQARRSAGARSRR